MLENFLNKLVQSDLMPHGYCIQWSKPLLLTYLLSDGLIFLAYISIPALLVYLIGKREDFRWKPIVALFAAFILACGTTHLLDILTLWIPLYWLDAIVDAMTALISLATVFYLYRSVPVLLALPSLQRLQHLNRELAAENEQRKAAELQLQASEQRWMFALESGSDGVWDWDLRSGEVFLSNR